LVALPALSALPLTFIAFNMHTDISLRQYAASGVIKAPAQKAQDYFKSICDARAACASTALDPVQKSISRSSNKKANEKIRKYRPGIQTKNNRKNATGYTSFCHAISSSNAILHPSSLDFIKAVVVMDTVFILCKRVTFIIIYARGSRLSLCCLPPAHGVYSCQRYDRLV
jgi:hypothetical protein